MHISLERDTGRQGPPVYRQIAEQIRGEIDAGRLCEGERLPPIRDLARRLAVNRDTVALAYEKLAAAGVIESTVGRGTFVRAPRAAVAPPPLFQPELSRPISRVLEFERARPRFGTGNGAVAMHSLVPDPSLFPVPAFRKALNRALDSEGADILLYGGPQGHLRLREVIGARLSRAAIDVAPDNVVLCHGASQGISLALRLFAEPGDAVAVEEPTYNNVLAIVSALGLEVAPIPMRDDGLDLAALERALERKDVKLLYTIPTFHNPMGTTSTLAHRRALLEIAARHAKPVVEDGYEMDLRLDGRAVPPLAALDDSGLVVHLFSFSKSLFPGARVGAITARGRLVEALLALKQATDLSDSMLLQAALAEFVASGAYDRHLARLRPILTERRDAVLEGLRREMPPDTRFTVPEGGLQIWVTLPAGVDTSELLADAVGAGALFAPGSQFYHDGRASNCLRLSIAMADVAALERGVRALARVVRDRLANEPARAVSVHI